MKKRFIIIFLLFLYFPAGFAGDFKNVMNFVWGKPTMPLTITPFMYTYHIMGGPNTPSLDGGQDNNNPMLGIVYHGIFVASFVNSFNKRSFTIGIQRYWVETKIQKNTSFAIGYRLGGILGYQNQPQFPYRVICRYQPVMPLAQLISDITYRRVGFEFGYTWDIISGSLYIRF